MAAGLGDLGFLEIGDPQKFLGERMPGEVDLVEDAKIEVLSRQLPVVANVTTSTYLHRVVSGRGCSLLNQVLRVASDLEADSDDYRIGAPVASCTIPL